MESMDWLKCSDEMKMDSFIEQFQDEVALRKFSILNSESVSDLLVDSRSKAAVDAAKAYLSGSISTGELERAYLDAETACEDIESAGLEHDDDPTEHEEIIENAALVAMWSAYPVGYAETTPLESARD